MSILIFFSIFIAVIIKLHLNKQKKSVSMHNNVANSLQMQLAIENQRKQELSEKAKFDFNTNFKLDILSKQVQLLEIISNQTN